MLFDWCSLFRLGLELCGRDGGRRMYSEMSRCRLVSL